MFTVSFACAQLLTLLFFVQTEETTAGGFKELGSLFLWGMLGAVGLSIIVVLIWLKIKSRRDESAFDHVSINPSRHGHQG